MASSEEVFHERKAHLLTLLSQHEAVEAYHTAAAEIEETPQLAELAGQMKAYQQEAVLYQKIDKEQAYTAADQKAELIRDELEDLPIVQNYRQKMQDASDLVQYVTKSIEERINEALRHG